jgi:hypothetical protein
MRARTWMAGPCLLLALLSLLSVGACAESGTSTSPEPTPSLSPSSAPSQAETVAAIKKLIARENIGYIETITVFETEQDASGRWMASAHLTPPASASYWPSNVVVVKAADGWRIVSLRVDKSFGRSLSPDPSVQPQ